MEGEFALALFADFALQNGLTVGAEITGAELERLSTIDEEKKAIARGIFLLASRPHSRAELIRKLTDKGFNREVSESGADFLAERGYLDDREFAKMYLEHLERKGFGKNRLKEELYKKGVPNEIIAETLAEKENGADEIRAFIEKKLRGGQITDQKQKNRIVNGLIRYGFGYNEIKPVLAEFIEGIDEEWE